MVDGVHPVEIAAMIDALTIVMIDMLRGHIIKAEEVDVPKEEVVVVVVADVALPHGSM
jgi:hypothetical protein